MKPVIAPVEKEKLLAELTADRFVRDANNGDNEIYIITHHNSPNVMREIGRLREVTFRAAGGGTGEETDIDDFDTSEAPYRQLIVWNRAEKEIVGGYRYIKCGEAPLGKDGIVQLATTELFRFSEKFVREYLPYTIELGRSFVQPKFQPAVDNRKGLFSLDNLWDGLGALVIDNPEIRYFYGKVTMYRHVNNMVRDMILHFMNYYFPDKDALVIPHHALPITSDMSAFAKAINGLPYKEGHRVLNQNVRALGHNIPPLVNSYMNISPSMKTFGTSLNPHFGDVEETGILVTLADIYDTKKERHVSSYKK